MSLYTELQTVVQTSQQKESDAHDSYMSHAGPVDIQAFLTAKAQKGQTQGQFHIEKEGNARTSKAGFMSLSGQIGTLHPENTRGVIDRNDIGWFYFNMPTSTTQQFHDEIADLITYLTSEGLTIESNQIGTEMADIIVSWN